ncbi:MAG: hypothetical protein H6868_01375 [Rhodospirillales bacterium]|nr:hypothetical protein [Rhodospirillales bacterium]
MPHITPTLGIRETGAMIRTFTKENMGYFWLYLRPLLPWIIGLHALDVLGNIMIPQMRGNFIFGSVIAAYFYTCFMITWHRVVLFGPERTDPVNPFKPEKSDLAFLGMGIGVFLGLLVIGALSSVLFFLGAPGIIMFVAIIIFLFYAFIKVCFYFPAKAVRSHLSLRQSYKATNGYIWKIMSAPFFASWRIILASILYGGITGGIVGALTVAGVSPAMIGIINFIVSLPMLVYLQPVSYALGVGVLSNYYQHAMQNKTF